jgi:hypothetical protein
MAYLTKLSKKKNSYILVELLIAFFIATTTLSGFFSFYSFILKKEISALRTAKMWLVVDDLMQEFLQEPSLKQTLYHLEEKKKVALSTPYRKSIALNKDMKMQLEYQFFGKLMENREEGLLKFIEITLDVRCPGDENKTSISYPLAIKFSI